MYVFNRSGVQEPIRFDKITDRNVELSRDLDVNIEYLSQLVIKSLKNGMTTSEIDKLSAETAYCMSTYYPDYDILASRISISDLTKSTSSSFLEVTKMLYNNVTNSLSAPLISDDYYNFVLDNIAIIQKSIDYARDYYFSYFGFKTLERSYLRKIQGKVVERPQHFWMRVALTIHKPRIDLNSGKSIPGNIDKALNTYNSLSKLEFTHATPTLANAGGNDSNLSSCYLLNIEDSITNIYETLGLCAQISKKGAGIGIGISEVRSRGSIIKSNGGKSDGIMPMVRVYDESSRYNRRYRKNEKKKDLLKDKCSTSMIKVFNKTAEYVNQSGVRKGSFALYMEPWHPEIIEFINLRNNKNPEEMIARDMFLALWIPDLFMKRVKEDKMWSLIDPSVFRDNYGVELSSVYGEEFERLYETAEREGKITRKIKATDIWKEICKNQEETGLPYMLYKDSVNKKSNQKNIGTIRNSNLCIEIVEYCDKNNAAVCTLASISLPKHLDKDKKFDFTKLQKTTETIVENLNNIIDINSYPVVQALTASKAQRAIGIGVQGLADIFFQLGYSWDSKEAKRLNRYIFEIIYYSAVKKSSELAQLYGSYPYFEGSPISKGILSPDMWDEIPLSSKKDEDYPLLNWNELREMAKKGMRNSLLIAPMPTATTSQLLGNTESFEPLTSNIYSRTVLSGEFPVINKYLYYDLKQKGLWTRTIVNKILENEGSVQGISEIPEHIQNIYKTVWDIPQRIVIDFAKDRAPFIDQNQSMNIHMAHPTLARLSSMHFYAWGLGMKCSSYYVRTKPARSSIKFGITPKESEAMLITLKESEPKEINLKNQGEANQDSGHSPINLKGLSEANQDGGQSPITSNESNVSSKNKEEAKLACSLKNKENCTYCTA